MFDLENFSLSDMIACGSRLRGLGAGAASLEQVAGRIVRHLYENLVDSQSGKRSCAMIRFYTTHPFGELDDELRKFAHSMLGEHSESPAMKCLVLLATAGDRPEWNQRANSAGHKAIPLPSEKIVAQFPMISQLLSQFGLEIGSVLKPDPAIIMDYEQKTFNVFHVSEAVGSPYIPAQTEFVIPLGIRSVLGFGGMLPSGELFASIMFSKVHISSETAHMFETLALSAKLAVLPFAGGRIFE